LQSRDSRWSPVSPALFADGRSVEPTRVFLETAEGTEMVTNLQTKQKVSRLFAFTKTAYWYGLMPLSLLATGVASLFWIVGALRKRVRGGRAWLVRLVPGLAVYAAPALIVALVSAMSTPDPNLLGVASPSSVVVFALSLLAPASAVAALLVMLKSRGVAGAPARLIGWLNTGVALAANLYFLHHGLLALRTWVL
jgi:hypothetical protein